MATPTSTAAVTRADVPDLSPEAVAERKAAKRAKRDARNPNTTPTPTPTPAAVAAPKQSAAAKQSVAVPKQKKSAKPTETKAAATPTPVTAAKSKDDSDDEDGNDGDGPNAAIGYLHQWHTCGGENPWYCAIFHIISIISLFGL